MNNLLGLSNGKAIDPYNFIPTDDFDPEVVAKSLSNLCRYNGHYGWLSVAEHSVIVANIMGERWDEYIMNDTNWRWHWKMMGLLHDSMESVFGDITSPVKHHNDFWRIRTLEKQYLSETFAIHRIHASRVLLEQLHEADKYAMSIEIEHLGQYDSPYWTEHIKYYPRESYPDVIAQGLSNKDAERLWLDYYRKVKDQING